MSYNKVTVGDCVVWIKHQGTLHTDHICHFTVTAEGVTTVYFAELGTDIAAKPRTELAKYLLRHLRGATVIESYKAKRGE